MISECYDVQGKLEKKTTAQERIDSENGLEEKSKEDTTSVGAKSKPQTVNEVEGKKTTSIEGASYVEKTEKVRGRP